MGEKAIRHEGKLWAYEPDAPFLSLRIGCYLVYRDDDEAKSLRVGQLKDIDEELGIYVVGDDYMDSELYLVDLISVARPISSRRQLRR